MKKLKPAIKITGTVIPGEKVGHKIGFPTANLKITSQKLNLKKGVYAAVCQLKGNSYLALAYFGPRYIFKQKTNSFEVYLLNFNQEIYHQKLSVLLTHYLRSPKNVRSLKRLKTLLKKDQQQMTKNQLVLINRQDQPLAIEGKTAAHLGKGKLHRAISIFLFNKKGELLIQQRSSSKMLWPLYWTNTACSHPQPGEDYQAAAERRLQEEFGIKAKLKLHHKFIYHEKYKNIGSEHELDAVFTGISDVSPKPDQQEIADWQYIKLADLRKEIKKHPNKYTPWFKLSLKKLKSSDIFKA